MSESKANERQEGGNHYRKIPGEQHWDRAVRLNFDFFQYMITKYVERCWEKNGLEDLRKALHFTQKYIEVSEAAGRTGARERAWLGLEQTILAQGDEIKRLNETDAAEAARANADMLDWLMQNVIVTSDGTFTMPDGTVFNCLRGKPHDTFYDFVHEGSYGDGRKLWTCTVCRAKVHTSGAEKPHKLHSPGGLACITQRAAAEAARAAQNTARTLAAPPPLVPGVKWVSGEERAVQGAEDTSPGLERADAPLPHHPV